MSYVLIDRTAKMVFGPSDSDTSLVALGTLAGALDANFSTHSELEVFQWNGNGKAVSIASVQAPGKFGALDWIGGNRSSESVVSGIIAGGMDNGMVMVWDARNLGKGVDPILLTRDETPISSLEFNQKIPHLLACGAGQGAIWIFDLSDSEKHFGLGSRNINSDDVCDVEWNKQVPHILATCVSSQCLIWDLRTHKHAIQINLSKTGIGLGSVISNLCWNPQVSTQILTSSLDDTSPFIYSWDLRNAHAPEKIFGYNEETRTMENGHRKGIMSMSWNPKDKDMLLSSGKDGSCLLWDTTTGTVTGDVNGKKDGFGSWIHQCSWYGKNPDWFGLCSLDGKVKLGSLSGLATVDDSYSFLKDHVPGWYKRPSSGAFGFDGKLVTSRTVGKNRSEVLIDVGSALYGKDIEDQKNLDLVVELAKGRPMDENSEQVLDRFLASRDHECWRMLVDMMRRDEGRMCREIARRNIDERKVDRTVLLLVRGEYGQLIEECISKGMFFEAMLVGLLEKGIDGMERCCGIAIKYIEAKNRNNLFLSLMQVRFDQDIGGFVSHCDLKRDFFVVFLTLLELDGDQHGREEAIELLGERCLNEARQCSGEERHVLLTWGLLCMMITGRCCMFMSIWIEMYGKSRKKDLVEIIDILTIIHKYKPLMIECIGDEAAKREQGHEVDALSDEQFWIWMEAMEEQALWLIQRGLNVLSYEKWTLILHVLSMRAEQEAPRAAKQRDRAVKWVYRVYRSLSSEYLVYKQGTKTVVGVRTHKGTAPLPSHWDSDIMTSKCVLPGQKSPLEQQVPSRSIPTQPPTSGISPKQDFWAESKSGMYAENLFAPQPPRSAIPAKESLFVPKETKSGMYSKENLFVPSTGPVFDMGSVFKRPEIPKTEEPKKQDFFEPGPVSIGSGRQKHFVSEAKPQPLFPQTKPASVPPSTVTAPPPPPAVPILPKSPPKPISPPTIPPQQSPPHMAPPSRTGSIQSPPPPPTTWFPNVSSLSLDESVPPPPPSSPPRKSESMLDYEPPARISKKSESVLDDPEPPARPSIPALSVLDHEESGLRMESQESRNANMSGVVVNEFEHELAQIRGKVRPGQERVFEDTEKRIQTLIGKMRDGNLSGDVVGKIEQFVDGLRKRDYAKLGETASSIIANNFREVGSSAIALKKLIELSKSIQ